jgi:hypothetical protein
MKADGTWDEIDFADIFRGLERFFGFECAHKEWLDFFGFDVVKRSIAEWDQKVAPNLTFGALARFIADRAPRIASFDPISVFGRDCESAGVFSGIHRLAGQRFAPSARIIDVMRGHGLDRFWTQLRWMTENSIPPLPSFWRGVTGITGSLSVLAVIGGLIAAGGNFRSDLGLAHDTWRLVLLPARIGLQTFYESATVRHCDFS